MLSFPETVNTILVTYGSKEPDIGHVPSGHGLQSSQKQGGRG